MLPHFADQMQHGLYEMVTKLHSLKLRLLHMQRTVLTGLFHIDETVVEAGKVAVEILAARYMEASKESVATFTSFQKRILEAKLFVGKVATDDKKKRKGDDKKRRKKR